MTALIIITIISVLILFPIIFMCVGVFGSYSITPFGVDDRLDKQLEEWNKEGLQKALKDLEESKS